VGLQSWPPAPSRHNFTTQYHLLKQVRLSRCASVRDATVLDLEEIGRNEGNRLPLALRLAEGASEMAV